MDDMVIPTYFGEKATPSPTLAAKLAENKRRQAKRTQQQQQQQPQQQKKVDHIYLIS